MKGTVKVGDEVYSYLLIKDDTDAELKSTLKARLSLVADSRW